MREVRLQRPGDPFLRSRRYCYQLEVRTTVGEPRKVCHTHSGSDYVTQSNFTGFHGQKRPGGRVVLLRRRAKSPREEAEKAGFCRGVPGQKEAPERTVQWPLPLWKQQLAR